MVIRSIKRSLCSKRAASQSTFMQEVGQRLRRDKRKRVILYLRGIWEGPWSSIHGTGTQVTEGGSVIADCRGGGKEEEVSTFVCAEKVAGIKEEIKITYTMHPCPPVCAFSKIYCYMGLCQPVNTDLIQPCWLRRLYKMFGVSHTIKMSYLVTTVS